MVTVEGFSWTEDVARVGLLYSSPVLTSTTTTLVICLAICVKQDSKAATFNTFTSTCNCFNSLLTATPVTGNRLWKRKLTQVEGYVYNSQLDWFIKVVTDQWIKHTDAETFCNADGGRLVVLDTDEKFAYVTGLPDIQISEYYHLGADDIAVEDTFVWTTGVVMNRNRPPWAEYQPDNYLGNQNCLALFNHLFDDIFCSDHMNFICEYVLLY
ncbi:uncharacterized protein [Argopecten irradians]|uniref:uncharacterized protein n=1 Tax=Argopecten irradians TaxID=31199 RepID=UPI00371FB4CC